MRCQYNEQVERKRDDSILCDLPLIDFLAPDGLMMMLRLIEEHSIPEADLLEMIRRLHVPGYEEARRHLSAAIDAGEIDPSVTPADLSQRDIEVILAFAKENR